jgi:hypothetical protein
MRVRDCARREVARWTNSEGRLPLRVGRREDNEVSTEVVAIFVAYENWTYKMLNMLAGFQASRCTELHACGVCRNVNGPSQFDAVNR